MDGIIVASYHIIAAVGVDAQGNKHVLGLALGSSENAKVVKDLLATLADRGVDLNVARLWVIDRSKALRWTAAGFLEAEKSFRKLRGFAQLKSLINGLRPRVQPLKKAAQFP